MNHDLCARGSHVRCYCRVATGYNAVRSLHRQMGSVLANHLSADRAVLMQDIAWGCGGGSETDARTHRTQKHDVRNTRETRDMIRVNYEDTSYVHVRLG